MKKIQNWRKPTLILVGITVLYFLLASFFLITRSAPFLITGMQEAQKGEHELISNPGDASVQFSNASAHFESAVDNLRTAPLGGEFLAILPPFRWEVELAKAATYLSNAGSIASNLTASYPTTHVSSQDINGLLSQNSSAFFGWYTANQTSFDNLQTDLQNANNNLQAVPSWILLTQSSEFSSLQHNVQSLTTGLPQFRSAAEDVSTLLGAQDSSSHTIAVLFQNDAELRPSGGFIGSYGTLVASGGVIREFKFGTDIYKLDPLFDGTNGTYTPAPEPLKTLIYFESLRDSNLRDGFLAGISPNVQKFLTTATGSKPEAIIYLDSTILEDMLRLTGPLLLPNMSTPATADTINETLTEEVEKTYFEDPQHKIDKDPKSIINNLIPDLIAKLQHTPGIMTKMIPTLMGEVERKSLQFWSDDSALETILSNVQPLDSPPAGNWIKLVNINLGGMKSSRAIHENIVLTSSEDILHHTLVEHLEVTRTHTGTDTWPDGRNKNYVEIYLPLNATITQLPVNIGGENKLSDFLQKKNGVYGKVWKATVTKSQTWQRVEVWESVNPGSTITYNLTYTLPLTSENEFHLSFLKQAGSQNQTVTVFGQSKPLTKNIFFNR